MERVELFNNHFQNYKVYGIPKAQLIIADPPYNLGKNAYGSNPKWYIGGDNKNGESELAGKEFFDTDKDFRPAEFMHFCSQMLVKEPKQAVFCSGLMLSKILVWQALLTPVKLSTLTKGCSYLQERHNKISFTDVRQTTYARKHKP